MLNWQWVLSDILGENSIKKRRSNSFQKAFERRLCFDRMVGVTGIFERISFLLQKSLFVFHDHRISFCGIYMFADSDVTFYWRDLGRKGNMLTVSYDNQYLHNFTYYSSRIGSNKGDYVVPDQFSHNISFSYSLQKGRYNVSLECRNFTDEKLYDNFSLQKAGRAFYGKLRVCFGN